MVTLFPYGEQLSTWKGSVRRVLAYDQLAERAAVGGSHLVCVKAREASVILKPLYSARIVRVVVVC